MNARYTLSFAARLTIAGLAGTAIGIWIQSISGVPDYPSRFPPGPIVLLAIAAAIALGARWRWTPILGALISLQIIIGAIVLPGIGFASSASTARMYCLGFGGFYLAFGLLGMVSGDPAMSYAWHVGPMHLDMGDHLFHLVLGPFLLASGFFTKRPVAG